MLDIIIPVYNSKKTLFRTLLSISIQTYNDIHVYLINDADDINYDDEINFFSKYFPIKELRLTSNSVPGVARQKGIDSSKSPYILFIDSDDYLYNSYALEYLVTEINKNYDLVISNFIYERDNEITVKQNDYTWLHGKIYRRSFLEQEQIRFNNTRSNEDNGFNRLIILSTTNHSCVNKITYVYSENESSITRKNNRLYKYTGLEGYSYNMNWAMNIMINKNKNLNGVAMTALSVLISMYYYYLELQDMYDCTKIFNWSADTKKIYDRLKNIITDNTYDYLLNARAALYPNVHKTISFDEFLAKVGNSND